MEFHHPFAFAVRPKGMAWAYLLSNQRDIPPAVIRSVDRSIRDTSRGMMKAIAVDDFESWSLSDVEKPSVAAHEALIAVSRVQLSVTECLLFEGAKNHHYKTVQKRFENTDDGIQMFGHEFCGEIVETGDAVTDFAPGDRIYVPAKIPCNECPFCESGFEHLCPDKGTIGMDRPGALAEYISLPAAQLCSLPNSVSDQEGAALQPLASAILCVEDANIETGDSVAIIGTGVMGSQCAQLALQQGASRVFAVDIEPTRLEIAERNGMIPINAREADPVEKIMELTGGIGVDHVFEAVGGRQTEFTTGDGPLAQAFRVASPGGTIVQVGLISTEMNLKPQKLRSKGIKWINPLRGSVRTGPNMTTGQLAVELLDSDRISIDEYITHELRGLESFEELVDITLNKEEYDALGPAQIIVA